MQDFKKVSVKKSFTGTQLTTPNWEISYQWFTHDVSYVNLHKQLIALNSILNIGGAREFERD